MLQVTFVKASNFEALVLLVVAFTSCDAAASGIPVQGILPAPSVASSTSLQHTAAGLDLHASRVLAQERACLVSLGADDISKATHDAWKSHQEWSLSEGPKLPRDSPAWASLLTRQIARIEPKMQAMQNQTKSQMQAMQNQTQSQIARMESKMQAMQNQTKSQMQAMQNQTQSQIARMETVMNHISLQTARALNRNAVSRPDPIDFPPRPAGAPADPPCVLPETFGDFNDLTITNAQRLCAWYNVNPLPPRSEQSKVVLGRLLGLRTTTLTD